MMITLNPCPHCSKENVAADLVGFKQTHQASILSVAFACNSCSEGVVARVKTGYANQLSLGGDIEDNPNIQVLSCKPEYQVPVAPLFTPPEVAKPYIQGCRNLEIELWDGAGMLFRKTLEISTKELAPGFDGTLFKRIEHLGDERLLTPSLVEWANIVRTEGNDAAHDSDFTAQQAQEIADLTHAYLVYAHNIPGFIEQRRAEKEDDKS